jgi:oligopeptide/dipeptide ABC transporter ATP-binding protein
VSAPMAPGSARAASPDGSDIILSVRELATWFDTMDGTVRAVDGVDLDLRVGRTLGLVGESGCGKSITALSILRLIERPGRIVGGRVMLGETDLLKLDEKQIRSVRGNRISMIFQEPMTSLNPVYTCGRQISEAVRAHRDVGRSEAEARAVDMLGRVGIPDPARRARQYPHELSGGMRQRVMIAMALSTDPDVLIADEPTTALDVTIQAQIFELIRALRDQRSMSMLLITHDLGVIAEMADEVIVMYSGKVFERAAVNTVMEQPHNPYTRGLLASIPRLGARRHRLDVIQGVVPNPLNLPKGCLFKRRCPYAMPICDTPPPLREVASGHLSRCWLEPDGSPPPNADETGGPAVEQAATAATVEERRPASPAPTTDGGAPHA